MTDVISSRRKSRTRPAALDGDAVPTGAGRDAALLPFVEMLFFAYRDFTGEADAALAAYGLGRAHHRVLHFVNRHPAIRVADLLELLKITKQSLGRVLRQLVQDGWIEQMPGPNDRRERRLTLTQRGRTLATELAHLQTRRIEAALGEIEDLGEAEPREYVRRFLLALIVEDERVAVTNLVAGPAQSVAALKTGGA
jgi:DNA-binding MarR family transcriptional regulator